MFDSVHEGSRQICLVNVEEIVSWLCYTSFSVDTFNAVTIMLARSIHQAGGSTTMANWLLEQDWVAI